jgi:predicted acylesterase/phospholipase RssA
MSNTSAPSPERRVRALAFAGGGFDTIMQLGVAHALLVSKGGAPDYVVGVSAGAINAAALAEILQAGGKGSPALCLDRRIEKLRQFLNAYQEVPATLINAIVPDTFEVIDNEPLAPLQLPVHFAGERVDRENANRSKAGLIRLLNRLWGTRLTIGTATRFIRQALSINEAGAAPTTSSRLKKIAVALGRILVLGWRNASEISPLFWSVAHALTPPHHRVSTSAGVRILRWRRLRSAYREIRRAIGVVVFALIAWPVFLVIMVFKSGRKPGERRGPALVARLLQHFELGRGIGNTDVLKQELVKCFDKHYYGELDLAGVLETALDDSNDPSEGWEQHRLLGDYATRTPGIVVAPIAANVFTGQLQALDAKVPVVDGLLAATATVPLFPAVKIGDALFIDGLNISNEALAPLMDLLRKSPPPSGAEIVDLYPISPQPISNASLGIDQQFAGTGDRSVEPENEHRGGDPLTGGREGEQEPAGVDARFDRTTGLRTTSLLQLAVRARQLRRFRDATMEQRLTKLYGKILPPGRACTKVGGTTYIRTAVFPLELEKPIDVNQKVLRRQSGRALSQIMYETVADGCRAALEGMIPGAVQGAAGAEPSVSCRVAVQRRLGAGWSLPGSSVAGGPGLAEICAHCALNRPAESEAPNVQPQYKQTLRVRPSRASWPEWPVEGTERLPVVGNDTSEVDPTYAFSPKWPREPKSRPLIALLFGGGVFRGVFHIGVANALKELGVRPDLVAGSSVGSIIAAMIAQLFTLKTPQDRSLHMARLASTFLAMDRLILTDRIADFTRRLTIRAAETDFALHDIDLLLRRYDHDSNGVHNRRRRRVAAGLERLFYLSPYALRDLTKAAGLGDQGRVREILDAELQDFLDRSGIGLELLGSEPLALLIQNEVLDPLARSLGYPADTFDAFLDTGVYFLATSTNLHQGSLEVFGTPYAPRNPTLLYGLLASSAFPGIFRPRESWEIFRNSSATEQYIDGGTIDNLPLDAVARFLDRASKAKHIPRRPVVNGVEVPHLLFTASLERDVKALKGDSADIDALREQCLELRSRATTFTHNRKVDDYARVQDDLRLIHQQGFGQWTPVDLRVVAVKPRWLCSTFGLHPMLGFRRRKQAQSIAHGCASTIVALAREARTHPQWADAWGLTAGVGRVHPPMDDTKEDPPKDDEQIHPRRANKARGECWFRDGVPCPFSAASLEQLNQQSTQGSPTYLGSATAREVGRIYDLCGKDETHRAYD